MQRWIGLEAVPRCLDLLLQQLAKLLLVLCSYRHHRLGKWHTLFVNMWWATWRRSNTDLRCKPNWCVGAVPPARGTCTVQNAAQHQPQRHESC